MSKWKMVRLEDVCSSIVRGPFGSALKKEFFVQKSQDSYKVYEQKHAIQKEHNIGEYYIDKNKYEELNRFKVKPKDIIISCSGTIGEIYQLPQNCEEGVINQALLKLTLKDKIDSNFFQYFWNSSIKLLNSRGSGIKNIASVRYIREMKIPLPPLDVQKHVADTLNKSQEILDCHKKQIEELNNLIKLTFYDIFGDPSTNNKGWNKLFLKDLSENLDSKRVPIAAKDRVSGQYPYYGASGIVDHVDDYLFDEELLLVSEDGANLLARVSPIAFSVIGKVWVNNHAHVLRFDNKSTQRYTEFIINLIDISSYITGSAQPKLNQTNLNRIEIPVPPIELQNKFSEIVSNIEEQKSLVKQSIKESENLFNSLMSKYFD